MAPSWVDHTIASHVGYGGLSIRRVENNGDLSILSHLLSVADLDSELRSFGDAYTLLAPTDAAFEVLGADVLNALRDPANINNDLLNILLYHVVLGVFTSSELSYGQQLLTVEKGLLSLLRLALGRPQAPTFNSMTQNRGV
jgi:uncharacterized surface protein with fasciclin (FAS1) repeats